MRSLTRLSLAVLVALGTQSGVTWGQGVGGGGGAAGGGGGGGGGLRPVPTEAAVVDAKRSLRERFAKDFADVSPAGKRRLAGLLMREAGKTAGDAGLWVALSEARDLAVGAGEAEVALAAAGELGRRFEVDGEAGKVAVLQGLVGGTSVKLSAQQAGIAARAGRGIVEAKLAADDFEGAARVAAIAEQAGRQAGDTQLGAELAMLVDFCRDVVRRASGYRAAMKVLDGATDETPAGAVAQANQTAGEFLVLVKQEWGRGLVMLSKGTEKPMRDAASAELGNERGGRLAAAGAAWEAWAKRLVGPGKRVAQRHALKLYFAGADGLDGEALKACRQAAAGIVNSWPAGTELLDGREARAKLGDERWGWWDALRVGEIEMREDAAELVNSQVVVAWSPRLDEADEAPAAPEGAKLTYVVRVLCVDERGEATVLTEEGRVTWRAANKPLRLTGPKNSAVKKANAGKLVPAGAWVQFLVDGVAVGERVWKLPVKEAWWVGGK